MTLQELNTALSAVLPGKVVYNAWPVGEAPALPFICHFSTGSDNFAADNVVYGSQRPVGEAPALPFICYFSTGSDNFAADNVVYGSQRPVRIELYTKQKDLATEAALEAKLTHEGIYWTRDESFIDDEKVFLTVYEVQING